jgi:hypothetical protein
LTLPFDADPIDTPGFEHPDALFGQGGAPFQQKQILLIVDRLRQYHSGLQGINFQLYHNGLDSCSADVGVMSSNQLRIADCGLRILISDVVHIFNPK